MSPRSEGITRMRVGALLIAGLAVLALGIIAVSSKQHIFSKKVGYFTIFPDANGLKVGDMVQYQGVSVGFVDEIKLDENLDSSLVYIHYKIDASVQERIKNTTRASVRSLGLLGDKYIHLYQKPMWGPTSSMMPGSEIKGDEGFKPGEIIDPAMDLLETLGEISEGFDQLLTTFNEGEGAIPRLLNDADAGRDTVDNLRISLEKLRDAMTSLNEKNSIAGALISGDGQGQKFVRDLRESMAALNTLTTALANGEGAMGALLKEGEKGDQLLDHLSSVSESLKRLVIKMENPNSLAHKVLLDPEYGTRVSKNLDEAVGHMNSILAKIDRGEGTLGGLVNDPGLYEDLKDVTAGVSESRLAKKAVSHYGKKGQKENLKKATKKELESLPNEGQEGDSSE